MLLGVWTRQAGDGAQPAWLFSNYNLEGGVPGSSGPAEIEGQVGDAQVGTQRLCDLTFSPRLRSTLSISNY